MPESYPFARTLSPRRQEVLELRLAGLTNPQIAARLVVSVKTVVRHMEDIRNAVDWPDGLPGDWLVVLACRYTAWKLGEERGVMAEPKARLRCTICGAVIDRRLVVLDQPGDPHYPSHAVCRTGLGGG
jgi:hypothetical protein